MWRCAMVLRVVAALALAASGCGKKAPPEGTGTVEQPVPTPEPTAAVAEITYQCPMHPDVTSDSPGQCTEEGCGAFLEAQVEEGQQVEYYCDMHDEPVVSEEPGKCPKCSMFMKARIKGAAAGEAGEPAAGGEEESEGAEGE